MAKKRKSIRKQPVVLMIGGEERAFESTDAGEVEQLEDEATKDVLMEKVEMENGKAGGDGADDPAAEETEEEAKAKEKAAEEWNAFKEEHHEIIEQLPLSLFRSMALLRELDDHVHESHNAILPAIRSYTALRKQIAQKNIMVQSPKSAHTEPPPAETQPNGVAHPSPLRKVSKASDSHAADGLEEGSSKSVSERLGVADEQTAEADSSAPKSVSSLPLPKPLLAIRPPNPFALKRSHSSFALVTEKIKAESPPSTREMLKKIAWLSAQCVKASEEKLGVASAAYNLVDRHVRALDAAIKEHENSLMLGLRPGTRPGAGMQMAGDSVLDGGDTPTVGIGFSLDLANKREKKRTKERERRERKRRETQEAKEAAARAAALEAAGAGRSPNGIVSPETPSSMAKLGMPVDPHEPRYCYCRQVGYGEMIGCDNENCVNEWFHLGCVGLTEAPKGEKKWYCRDCAPMFERPNKRRKA